MTWIMKTPVDQYDLLNCNSVLTLCLQLPCNLQGMEKNIFARMG